MGRPRKNVDGEESVSTESSKIENIDVLDKEEMSTSGNFEAKEEKNNAVEIIRLTPSTDKEKSKEKLKKLIAQETKKVKGRFRNYETPGGSLRVQIRKYPGIPPFDKVMVDNENYEVPLYVARHLNGVDITAQAIDGKVHSCAWPTHGFKWDPGQPMPKCDGDNSGIPVPIIGVTKWNRRFGFESLEFDMSA